MLILKLLLVFLSTKGKARNKKNRVQILIYSLLFLAAALSAVGSLVKSYIFPTDVSVCTVRNVCVPQGTCVYRKERVCTVRNVCVPQGTCVYRKERVCTVRNVCVPQGTCVYRKESSQHACDKVKTRRLTTTRKITKKEGKLKEKNRIAYYSNAGKEASQYRIKMHLLGSEISRVMELRCWYVTKCELNLNKHAKQ
jgi:hypothetical protein